MLGFVLDRIAAETYCPSEEESSTNIQREISVEKASIALKTAFFKIIG